MTSLALSDSFEYLCYGSNAIVNIFTFTVRPLEIFLFLQSSESLIYTYDTTRMICSATW